MCVWEAEFVCPRLVLEGSSILTIGGQSAFLFWAGDPLPHSRNATMARLSNVLYNWDRFTGHMLV